MTMQKLISNRWLNQFAGVVLVGLGIVAMSQPGQAVSLHCVECAAMHRLAPIIKKSEVGRQILAVYVERDAACHRI